jgi:hypothetical protein
MTSAEVPFAEPACFEQSDGIAYVRIRHPSVAGAAPLPTWEELCVALVGGDGDAGIAQRTRLQGTLTCRFG